MIENINGALDVLRSNYVQENLIWHREQQRLILFEENEELRIVSNCCELRREKQKRAKKLRKKVARERKKAEANNDI